MFDFDRLTEDDRFLEDDDRPYDELLLPERVVPRTDLTTSRTALLLNMFEFRLLDERE